MNYSYRTALRWGGLLSLFVILFSVEPVMGQQARGIFFNVFGQDAPKGAGDFDNTQAFYFEIPADDPKPIYLRIFDADVGGRYEERHGPFDTQTRFTLIGGESASKRFGGNTDDLEKLPNFENRHVLYDRTYGVDSNLDGRYVSLGELDKEMGYRTEDGYLRYVLLVRGVTGNDGNFFDLVLSYDPEAKDFPSNTRTYAYDLSIRIPDWPDFKGQVKLHTRGNKQVNILTYDMDGVPIAIERPFGPDESLETSGDALWQGNIYDVSNHDQVEYLGLNIEGRDFNNTFVLMVKDSSGVPLPIQLPIRDYQPPKKPKFAYHHQYASESCNEFQLNTDLSKQGSFQLEEMTWAFEDDTLRGASVTKQFKQSGYHPYKLTISGILSGAYQAVTFEDSLLVNQPPSAWAGGNRIHVPNEPMAFDGTVSEDRDGFITSYLWRFGDGTSRRGARVDHVYEQPGLYTVELTVRDNSNTPCKEASAQAQVKINERPIPHIIAPELVQVGEIFTLNGSGSRDPDGNIVDYIWNIGGDTTLTGKMVQYAFNTPVDRQVTLTVRDDSDVKNSVARDKVKIRINEAPIAFAGDDKLVSPNRPATFDASGSRDPDGEIIQYKWFFQDTVLEGSQVEYAFPEPGDYPVRLRVTDNSGTAFGEDTMYVHVNFPPQPVISGDRIYARGRVNLDGEQTTDQDGEIIKYQWDMGDGTVLEGNRIRHRYQNPGKYPVQLTVVDNSGTYSSVQRTTTEIVINQQPQARISAPKVVAPGEEVTFDGSQSRDPDGTIASHEWDFGEGTTLRGPRVKHKFDKPGRYQVQLKVQDDTQLQEGIHYTYQEIQVNQPPVINVDYNQEVVPGQELVVDASDSRDPDGEIKQYYWFENGSWVKGSASKTITAQKDMPSLRVAVEDDAGVTNSRVEKTISFSFNTRPVAVANDDVRTHRHTIVFDGSQSYDPDDDDLRYYWDFGDGGSAEGPIVSHTYRHGGTYQAVLTVDDQRSLNNSFAYDTVNVFINRPPDVFFELPSVVCQADTFTYDASKSFDIDGNDQLRYEWTFGDGNSAQSMTGTHAYQRKGTYQVQLTVDDTEGMPNSMASFTQQVRAVGAPEADAGEDRRTCAGAPIQFDGSSSSAADGRINRYEWDFGDGNVGSGIDPIHRYREPGVYTVTLRVTGNDYGSCNSEAVDQITVEVVPPPVAAFDLPRDVMEDEPITFDPSPSLDSTQSTINEIIWEIPNVDTLRWSKRTEYDSAGVVSSRNWVLSSTEGIEQQGGTTQSATGTLPTFTRDLPPGTHNVKLRIQTSEREVCNTAVVSRTITVKERPSLSLEDIPVLVPGTEHEFRLDELVDNADAYSVAQWNFGDGAEADGFVVSHAYDQPGVYTVEFTADDGRGSQYSVTELEQKVRVNAAPEPRIQGPRRITPGTEVEFSAGQSSDPDGEIAEYRWFFSDGTRKQGETVTHTFKRKGQFAVSLTVEDDAGVANSVQSTNRNLIVDEVPDLTLRLPTVTCPDVPINIIEGLSVREQDSTLVDIYIGDNEISYAQAQQHKFRFPGVYTMRVVVNDGSGKPEGDETVRQTLKVNGPPEIYAEVPQKITIGAANDFARFDASNTFDPNGDIISYYWNFGDGSQQAGKIVQHEYTEPGTYTVTIRAVDSANLRCSVAEKEFTVEVVRE
ncbi:MAG: PKD domain-containing protein [Bacteroidota bacterium]